MMINVLEELLINSELISLFELNRKDDNSESNRTTPLVSYRVQSNIYKIRAFEFIGSKEKYNFRIYHSDKIDEVLKGKFNNIKGFSKSTRTYTDYSDCNYNEVAREVRAIIVDKDILIGCKNNSTISKNSKFEGLELPDVDVLQDDVMGQVFTWREIISIWEADSEDNNLKKTLSKSGIYIQRDRSGKSRYIGSAYGEDGIIGRWMKHLESNGNAKYLNLFVLENGYNEILFSVIEFHETTDILKRENMWKSILGTVNHGIYNGVQLNNN